jgi:hypothetical protein
MHLLNPKESGTSFSTEAKLKDKDVVAPNMTAAANSVLMRATRC